MRRIGRRTLPAFGFAILVLTLGCGDDGTMDLFPNSTDGGAEIDGSRSSRLEGGSHSETMCTSNSQCTLPTPICEPTTHACVECIASTDCGGDRPVCDTRSFRCVTPCSTNGDCSSGSCDPAASVCVECLADSQCESPARCLLPQGTCVRCLSDLDCVADESHKHCWLAAYECVECTSSADCSGGLCTIDHGCAN